MEQGGQATSDRLRKQFSLLLSKVETFLRDSGCTLQSLLVCVMDVKHVRSSVKGCTLKELESASKASDVLLVLKKRNLVSSIHYEVAKHIIISLCSECGDLRMSLANYEAIYEQFSRTPVHKSCICREGRFEVLSGEDAEDNINIAITADDGSTSFEDIFDLENIIAKAFRCSQLVLHIRCIEFQPPHLTLVYGIPCSMVDSIFPLTLEEWEKLKFHGISEIHCTDWHYMLDEKGSAHVIECAPVLIVTIITHTQHLLLQSWNLLIMTNYFLRKVKSK